MSNGSLCAWSRLALPPVLVSSDVATAAPAAARFGSVQMLHPKGYANATRVCAAHAHQ
jgi:hypothetical protein